VAPPETDSASIHIRQCSSYCGVYPRVDLRAIGEHHPDNMNLIDMTAID